MQPYEISAEPTERFWNPYKKKTTHAAVFSYFVNMVKPGELLANTEEPEAADLFHSSFQSQEKAEHVVLSRGRVWDQGWMTKSVIDS